MIHLPHRKGSEHPAAALTPEEVQGLRQRAEREKICYGRMAEELGVSKSTVYRVVKRLTYRD